MTSSHLEEVGGGQARAAGDGERVAGLAPARAARVDDAGGRPGWRGVAASPALWLAVLIFVANVALMPRVFVSGDPWYWREETRSILRSGTLSIDPGFAARSGEPGQYFVRNDANGRWYSKYGVMNSIMALPPMLVESSLVYDGVPAPGGGSSVGVFGVYYALLSALTAAVLYAVTGRYTSRVWLRCAYVLACLYGTYVWFYERSQGSESYQVLFFSLLVLLLARGVGEPGGGRRPGPALAGAWACVAALVLTRVVFAVLILPVSAALLCAAWRRPAPAERRAARLRRLAPWAVLPPLAIVAAVGCVNWVKFGSPLLSGYHQWHAADHQLTKDWIDGVYGYLFSVRWSVFVYFPVLVLALPGVRRFAARFPVDAVVALGAFALLLVTLGAIPSWRGEWTYGPRYLIAILPVVALPALTWFDRLAEARPTPGGSWRVGGAGAVAVLLLLWSASLQWEVNRLNFWTVHQLASPFEEGNGNVWLFRYLNDHVEGTILRDLRSHEGDLSRAELCRDVARSFPPAAARRYEAYVGGLLAEANWYWWPPPRAVPSAANAAAGPPGR